MGTMLAWIVTIVIFGTIAAIGVITARFVYHDWRCARVSRTLIIATLAWGILPVHGIFIGTIIMGWVLRPDWWPPHGPDLASLIIPGIAVGMADIVLAAVLLCVWPKYRSTKP